MSFYIYDERVISTVVVTLSLRDRDQGFESLIIHFLVFLFLKNVFLFIKLLHYNVILFLILSHLVENKFLQLVGAIHIISFFWLQNLLQIQVCWHKITNLPSKDNIVFELKRETYISRNIIC